MLKRLQRTLSASGSCVHIALHNRLKVSSSAEKFGARHMSWRSMNRDGPHRSLASLISTAPLEEEEYRQGRRNLVYLLLSPGFHCSVAFVVRWLIDRHSSMGIGRYDGMATRPGGDIGT